MRLVLHLVQLLLWLVSARATSTLERRVVQDSDALCNDFSRATYYLSQTGSTDQWIIFFEGGGGCSSVEECNQRWESFNTTETRINPLMSSRTLEGEEEVQGRDLLSGNATENPNFYNFKRVLVPYCSQDAFLADRGNPNVNVSDPLSHNFTFNSTSDANNFVYKGRVIFQAVILELLLENGLTNASELVLAGSSSGGIGVLNHLPWVKEVMANRTLASIPPRVLAIVDSSWFVSFNENHAVSWNQDTVTAFNLPDACADFSFGVSCCTVPACLFLRGYLDTTNTSIFMVSSTHDIFTLEAPLLETLRGRETEDDQDLLRIFNSYGSIMNSTFLQSYHAYSNLTVFAPSCTQHVYLATSSLWDEGGALQSTVAGRVVEPPFVLTNPVHSGNWDRVKVEPHDPAFNLSSLHQAIGEWYQAPHQQVFYADQCAGPVCGDFCVDSIELEPQLNLWPNSVNILILVVSAMMTALPSLVKLGLYVHMKWILFSQRVFAFKRKHSAKSFPKATHPINVSCMNLYYRIDTVQTTTHNKEESSTSEDYTEDQYRLYAGFETFIPCCKKQLSGCVTRFNAPVDDQRSTNHTATAQIVRTDSGISSSVANHNRVRSITPISMDTVSMDSLDIDCSRSSLVETDGTALQPRRCVRTASSLRRERRAIRKKTILHRVNMYVNPGELVAVMGPSGSGKTTLLDVLLGRRRAGYTEGEILINGTSLHKSREWFIVNTGYVRQLAKSYYNELTVRENLVFSMHMQGQGMRLSEKLERVEQVIQEMGLVEQADIKRKRLAIAVQLLGMPNIIFLDEPTSGLDSATSLDILKSLQVMAGTGRAVVVTIHQPRSEIFHAFDKILLLCNGQIAFFGSPVKVWEFFRQALIGERELNEAEGQVQDAVLDLLKEKRSQRQVLHAYKDSGEPKHVQQAVQEGKLDHMDFPEQNQGRNPGIWNRLMSLESRASLRQTFFTIIYLPIVYTVFGLVLGTTYLFTDDAVQILSVTCLLSCSSSLFMSSITASLLVEPLKLFYLEHSDGISNSHELILQVFVRMTAVCTLPLSICSTLVFGLVYQSYQFDTYLILLLAFLLVNQVWISIFIVLTVLSPSQAHRLCPVFAAIGGFCCGFIVPKPLMPPYYRWIFYLNPSFYAFSATSAVVLEGIELECNRGSMLECFRTSGLAVLQRFGLEEINPFENLVVLMTMVVVLVLLGITVLLIKVNFGLITENLFNTFCAFSKRRRRKRIRSTQFLETVDHPTSTGLTRGRREESKATLALEESRRETLNHLRQTRPSAKFVEAGYHSIMHDFPWKADELLDLDMPDGDQQPEASNIFSPMSKRSRIASDGSEDVFEPEHDMMMIDMEEDRTEENRRIQANYKWNLRRQKIENEFLRLRHLSINRSRAVGRLRHSVSFGDDLEMQLEMSGMRNLESDDSEGSADTGTGPMRRERSMTSWSLGNPPSKPFTRSKSVHVPGKDYEDRARSMNTLPGSKVPTLETHQEFAEEEEEAEGEEGRTDGEGEEEEEEEGGGAMLGLPPKDVPDLSIEQLDQDWTETDNDEID